MAAVENKFCLYCLQMAEPQKANSSAVDSKSKEKISMIGIPVVVLMDSKHLEIQDNIFF